MSRKADTFAERIGLDPAWPKSEPAKMSIVGHTRFVASYIEAAERTLYHHEDVQYPEQYYLGPLVQLVGLAAELTFKTLLRGNGCSEKKVRSYGHSVYKAYYDAREIFDEVEFIGSVADNCVEFLPDQVRIRLNHHFGDEWPEGWNIFIPQIGLLEGIYDRPFRSRYLEAGPIDLPETFVIILGLKTLLAAMLERVGDDRLPGSLTEMPKQE